MSRIVMTGASGFLGRNTASKLAENGNQVFAIIRKESKNNVYLTKHENIKYIEGNLQRIDDILQYIDKADVFVHFGWDGPGSQGRYDYEMQNKNIDYGMAALEVARKLGCKTFVFSGSQAEYGMVSGKTSEENECKPIIAYGKAKLEFSKCAMNYCEEHGMRLLHLRIFSVYGINDRSGTLVELCIDAFNNGKHLSLGPCDQLWNYLYIDDFTGIVDALIKSDCASGTYNIAGVETKILREYVKDIYDLSNKSGSYSFDDNSQTEDKKVMLNPEISKLRGVISMMPQTIFKDGIRKIMMGII